MCKHKTASLRLSIGYDFTVPIYQCDMCGELLPKFDVDLDIDTSNIPPVDEWAEEQWVKRFWTRARVPHKRQIRSLNRRTMLRIAIEQKRKAA